MIPYYGYAYVYLHMAQASDVNYSTMLTTPLDYNKQKSTKNGKNDITTTKNLGYTRPKHYKIRLVGWASQDQIGANRNRTTTVLRIPLPGTGNPNTDTETLTAAPRSTLPILSSCITDPDLETGLGNDNHPGESDSLTD